MAVDFKAGYVPPGVYVSSDVTQPVGAVGLTASAVCLIGEGLGYRTGVEYISFSGGNSVVLSAKGIIKPASNDPTTEAGATFQVSAVVSGVATRYAQGDSADYTLAQTGTGADAVTTITRVPGSSNAIPTSSNVTVRVQYRYTDEHYYGLNAFTDFTSFTDVYGDPYDADGNIQSRLSLAARFAFANGAGTVYAVALPGAASQAALSAQFADAYTLTLNSYRVNILVPLFSDAVSLTAANNQLAVLTAHLDAADDASQPRIAVIGLPQDFSGVGPDTVAQANNHSRLVLLWPNSVLAYNTRTQEAKAVDGYYFAAGAAGVLANQSVNRGLTRAQIRAFSGLPQKIATAQVLPSVRNTWSASGVSVAEVDRQGRLIVRHGVTTDVSSIATREISIVRCRDALFTTIYQSLDQADLVGDPIVDETPLVVKGIISSALEQALAADVIDSYADLVVRQQALPTGDPTVIECRFSYKPTYPLNYITVVFTVDLTSGDVTATTTDTAAVAV